MALNENKKLWFIGVIVASIGRITVMALKKVGTFVEQFSLTPTIKQIQIAGAKLLNFPPIPGNAHMLLLILKIGNSRVIHKLWKAGVFLI